MVVKRFRALRLPTRLYITMGFPWRAARKKALTQLQDEDFCKRETGLLSDRQWLRQPSLHPVYEFHGKLPFSVAQALHSDLAESSMSGEEPNPVLDTAPE